MAQLTSLRFVAAFLVVLSHLDFLAESTHGSVRWLYDNLFSSGRCGVSFFYILSGFVMSLSYQKPLIEGRISFLNYALLRVARIAPLHWIVAAVFIVWLAVIKGVPSPIQTIILNWFLLQSWVPISTIYFSLNAPSWSLSNEVFFYLMLPLLVGRSTVVLLTLAAGGLATIFACAVYSVAHPDVMPEMVEWVFDINPLFRLMDFLTGVILYRASVKHQALSWANSPTEILLLSTWPLLMLAANLMNVPSAFSFQLLYIPLMSMTILVLSYGRGKVSKLLQHRVAVMLGEASFSLYITHRTIIVFVSIVTQKYFGTKPDWSLSIVLVAVCIGISILVYKFIERPIYTYLRIRINSRFSRREAMAV